MKTSKVIRLISCMLALIMLSTIFIGRTLSRFVETASSVDSARVAIWGINGKENILELFSTEYWDKGNVVAESMNEDNIIAPGTGGSSPFSIINFDNNISPEVAYEVNVSFSDSMVSDKIKNNPSIQWKLDNNDWGTWDDLKASLLALSGDESGTYIYAPGEFANAFKGDVEHQVHWQWILDNNNNSNDTKIGNSALQENVSTKISIKITAKQSDLSNVILSGTNQFININNVEPISIKSAAPLADLQEVKINGEIVNPENYTATEGSTVITLHKDYLETFGLGTYSIEIISKDFVASTDFTVGPSKVLSENSWQLISDVTKMGNASKYWSVGDKTTVDVNGKDYVVVIAGFDHDGEDTVTFTFTERVKNATMSSNSTWTTTSVRTTVLPNILEQMENKDYIIEVEKKTIKGFTGNGDGTVFEILTTNDKLFLPSWRELINVYNYKGEGEQYEYFKTKTNRIMGPLNATTGKGIFYWSRSPAQAYNGYNGISGDGEGDGNGYYCSVGIVPMFVIG